MSFGFSVSDFITLADKASAVYKRCKNAPVDYKEIYERVLVLKNVLSETTHFLEEEGVPNLAGRLESLEIARCACQSALRDVSELLDKHEGLVLHKKRQIELLRFISKDVAGLKERLDHSTRLLQIGLQSLQNFSVRKIQTTLATILSEYRSGLKEPTVISQVLHQGGNVDNDVVVDHAELIAQIHTDLEDKDVHPDCIDHNREFIVSWLSQIITDGGFHETSEFSQSTNGLWATSESHDRAERLFDSNQTAISSQADRPLETLSPVSQVEVLSAQDDSSQKIAAPPSIASNASTPRPYRRVDEWKPSGERDDDRVVQMLLPIFKADPYTDPEHSEVKPIFERAFELHDWRSRGWVADHQVLLVCTRLFKALPVPDPRIMIETTIVQEDPNRDGRVDREKFCTILFNLLQKSNEVARNKTLDVLYAFARHKNVLEIKKEARNALPWGISTSPEWTAWDDIELRPLNGVPALSDLTFTAMVDRASSLIRHLNDFEEVWYEDLQKYGTKYLGPLDTVRDAAGAYRIFKHPTQTDSLSDLDSIRSCTIINKGALPGIDILHVHEIALRILTRITGFVIFVVELESFAPSSKPEHRLQAYFKTMDELKFASMSRQIDRDMSDWFRQVQKPVEDCREWLSVDRLYDLDQAAVAEARKYERNITDGIQRLLRAPVEFEIMSITLERSKASSVFEDLFDRTRIQCEIHSGNAWNSTSPRKWRNSLLTWLDNQISCSQHIFNFPEVTLNAWLKAGEMEDGGMINLNNLTVITTIRLNLDTSDSFRQWYKTRDQAFEHIVLAEGVTTFRNHNTRVSLQLRFSKDPGFVNAMRLLEAQSWMAILNGSHLNGPIDLEELKKCNTLPGFDYAQYRMEPLRDRVMYGLLTSFHKK